MEVNSAKDTRRLFTALSMLQLHNAIGDQILVFDTKSKKPIASYTVVKVPSNSCLYGRVCWKPSAGWVVSGGVVGQRKILGEEVFSHEDFQWKALISRLADL